MRFYTFGCDCGCPDPLLFRNEDGSEGMAVFRTKEDAQVEASEFEPEMRVIECEVKIV